MKLPLNCEVNYFEDFLTEEEAKELFQVLVKNYEIDKARMIIEAGSKTIETDSFKILFFDEQVKAENSYLEDYQGKSFPFEGLLKKLKEKVEHLTNHQFDIAMCLYYPDGNYFAPYHSDQQTSGHKTILPSISLGAEREFVFRNLHDKETYSILLKDGSVIVMGDYYQSRYEHSLPKNPDCKESRINITFREASFK